MLHSTKETKVCLRCGSCCRCLAHKMLGMSPEVIDYLIKRGCTVDGDYLLTPHVCQHLKEEDIIVEVKGIKQKKHVATCDIHDTEEYPIICRRFHGFGSRYYIPEGCVFFDKEAERLEKEIMEREIWKKEVKKKGRY